MKRILHIPNFYAPNKGGIESACQYIINNLPSYEHRVICFSTNGLTYSHEVDGISIRKVGSFIKIASQSISFSYFFELKKILTEFKPDLVHFHAPNPLIMIYLQMLLPKSCKLIVHWHSDIVAQKHLYQFVRSSERSLLKRADTIIITSPNYLVGSIPLQAVKEKVQVVANAIESELFEMSPEMLIRCNELYEKHKHKKIVFFIGRHVPYKGLKYLLEAEKTVKNDCLFLIAGSGPLTESLKKEFQSKRLEFLGRLSDEDLRAYMHVADIFAFPSITKNEAFGIVLAEAMYCETPAVTFTIKGSGVNWVSLNQITGLEVENSRSDLFAKALDTLLENDALRNEYAQNAKSRVLENFVMDRTRPQLEKIYAHLLAQ